ncbi:hypothetical protein D9M68_344100 [compost metagenome]
MAHDIRRQFPQPFRYHQGAQVGRDRTKGGAGGVRANETVAQRPSKVPDVSLQGSLRIGRPILIPLERHLPNQWEFGPKLQPAQRVPEDPGKVHTLNTIEINWNLEVLRCRFDVGIERLRRET